MSKRIFIALDISEETKEKIARFISELKKEFLHLRVGWEKPEKIHLTLKFLGDIDEEQLSKVKEAVRKTASDAKAFSLRVEKTGCFPSPKKARILWLGLSDETGTLQNLHLALERELEEQGFEKEGRPFQAHLTIARLREPQRSRELVEAHLRKKFEPVSFEVSAIVIYESKLQPAGSVYSVVETINF